MPKPQRRFHREIEIYGCGRLATAYFGSILALVGMAISLALLLGAGYETLGSVVGVLYLAALTLIPSLCRGSLRAGILVDDRGLKPCYPLGFGRRMRWDEIEDVAVSDEGAVVKSARATIELRPPLADWLVIASRCEQALGRVPLVDPDDEVIAIPPAQVAAWLRLDGLAADEALVCTSAYHRNYVWWSLLALLLVLLTPLRGPVFIVLLATGLLSRAGREKGQRISEIRAGAQELEVRTDRGWRKVDWGGLKRLEKRGVFWVVSTPQGDLWLPPGLAQIDRLLHAVRQSIAARQQGFALPRMTQDVPDSAISRASVSVDDTHGLSRAEPPQ